VRVSDYRGQPEVQIEWVDARPVETEVVTAAVAPAVAVVDYRARPNARQLLEQLRAQDGVQVWAEAGAKGEVCGLDRDELVPSRELAVWTTPPGTRELRAVLKRVSPETVYLFGIDPGLGETRPFLQRLAGLVKRALSTREGMVTVSMLAAATAQREATVCLGLDWLVERCDIVIVNDEEGQIQLAPGSGIPGKDVEGATERLRSLLRETAAYRKHFSRAQEDALLSL